MRRRLEELVRVARALPGAFQPADVRPLSVVWHESETGSGDPSPLRRRTAALLGALAARLEPALLEGLRRAGHAWDQVDATTVLDDDLRGQVAALEESWRGIGGAAALEGLLVLQVATALVSLVERRLATFVRLRRGGELLPGGRPFLDLPGALAEVAARWAA